MGELRRLEDKFFAQSMTLRRTLNLNICPLCPWISVYLWNASVLHFILKRPVICSDLRFVFFPGNFSPIAPPVQKPGRPKPIGVWWQHTCGRIQEES